MIKRWATNTLLLLPVPLLVWVLYSWLTSYVPEHFYCRSADGKLVLLFVGPQYASLMDPNNKDYCGARVALEDIRTRNAVDRAFVSRWLGFEVLAGSRPNVLYSYFVLAIPYPLLAAIFLPLSIMGVITYRRRREWARPGRCHHCGYDLRASHERCPECGTPISVQSRAPQTSPTPP